MSVFEAQTAFVFAFTAGRGATIRALPEAAGRTADVAREPAVVGPGLPVLQVDLDTEPGLDPADREPEVRTEPGARVPFSVAVAGQVAVKDVPACCRDLVEQPGDRHLRDRRLGEPWRC